MILAAARGDTSQDQGPLRLQELEEGACHHGEAELLHHRLLARGRLCRRLLMMAAPRLLPWRQSLRHDWSERILRFELQEEMSRWLFNHFFDDDGNGEMSMKMIVTTKEAFLS